MLKLSTYTNFRKNRFLPTVALLVISAFFVMLSPLLQGNAYARGAQGSNQKKAYDMIVPADITQNGISDAKYMTCEAKVVNQVLTGRETNHWLYGDVFHNAMGRNTDIWDHGHYGALPFPAKAIDVQGSETNFGGQYFYQAFNGRQVQSTFKRPDGSTATPTSSLSQDQLAYLWNHHNLPVDTIQFTDVPSADRESNDGTNGSKCSSLTLVPTANNQWVGFQYQHSAYGNFETVRATFEKTGTSGNNITGRLNFTTSDGTLEVHRQNNFTVAPKTGGGGGPPPVAVNVKSAAFDDVGHMTVQTDDGNTDVYQKFDWNDKGYYFLVSSTNSDRNKHTWANAPNKFTDPLGGDKGKSQCVPFIYINWGDQNISFRDHNTGWLQSNLNKLVDTANAKGKWFDYDNKNCAPVGQWVDKSNGVPVVFDQPASGSVNLARVWLVYSQRNDKFRMIFTGGDGYEKPYIGEYTKDPSGNFYLGGSTSCKPGRITIDPHDGFTSSDNYATVHLSLQHDDCKDVYGSDVTVNAVLDESKFDQSAPAPDPGSTTPDQKPTCTSSGFSLSWLFCPIINGIVDTADAAFNSIVVPYLETAPVNLDHTSPQYRTWSAFRAIANILLIAFLLIAVYGEATGGGLVDSYTAKKIIPRLVAAVIMINLSIYLVALAVDVTNILGKGMASLVTIPFGQAGTLNFSISGGLSFTAILGTGVTGTAIWAAGGIGATLGAIWQFFLIFVLIPAALAMLGVIVTLTLRQGLIIFLMLSSPIAMALYVLPNTAKYAKSWWNLLLKTLMVYPIVMVIFAISKVIPGVIQLSGTGNFLFITDIIKILALVMPLFLVPFAFKMAGGVIGNLYGTLSGWNKKAHQGILGNPNDQNSLRNRSKRRLGEQLSSVQSRYTDTANKLDGSGNRRGNVFSRGLGRALNHAGNVDSRMARYNAISKEQSEQMSATGRDDLRYAAGGWVLRAGEAAPAGLASIAAGDVATQDRFINSKGQTITRAAYTTGKRLYGGTNTQVAQNIEYAVRKAQTDQDVGNMRLAFAKNAQANGWRQDEITDAWAAATFPHKAGLMASEWYSKPTLQPDGSIHFKDIANDVADAPGKPSSYTQFVGDLHKTRLGYQLPARDQDYRAMLDRQTQLEDKVISGATLSDSEAAQLAMTYEVFDAASTQYGTTGAGVGGAAPAPGAGPTAGVDRATAGSAASQVIIQQALAQRKDPSRNFSLQTVSSDVRNIVRTNPAGVSGVVSTATVTGTQDRAAIPRDIP